MQKTTHGSGMRAARTQKGAQLEPGLIPAEFETAVGKHQPVNSFHLSSASCSKLEPAGRGSRLEEAKTSGVILGAV